MLWGLGHLAIGDRRGWLLLICQPIAIGAVVALSSVLLDTTRWLLVFPAVLLLLALWLGQALAAYRQAIAAGAADGGELQITLFLPLVVVVVTAFWLLGGTDGSSATTLRRYVSAWEAGQAEAAVPLFATPVTATDLAAQWAAQTAYLRQRVVVAADQFPQSGVDPDQPFNSLLITEVASTDGDVSTVKVELVRRERVQTVLLGFIPTATQQTVVVEELGTVTLRALPAPPPAWLPTLSTGARVWRIDTVQLTTAGVEFDLARRSAATFW